MKSIEELINLDDSTKQALRIAHVSESELTISGYWRTIELLKYSDGNIELEMTDGSESLTYLFDKAQVEFLSKWLIRSC